MRDFSGRADLKFGDIEADIDKIQQCLDICAEASVRIFRIRHTIEDGSTQPENELFATPNMARMTTLDILDEYAEMLASISTRLQNDVVVVRRRLDCLESHTLQTNQHIETHLSISPFPCNQPHQGRIVLQTISTGRDSQQILVSTSGGSIYARNVTNGPRSSQLLGQMSDVSLVLLNSNGPISADDT